MVNENCKKHGIPFIKESRRWYCPVCEKIKELREETDKLREHVKKLIADNRKRFTELESEFEKKKAHLEKNAQSIYDIIKKQQEELSKI